MGTVHRRKGSAIECRIKERSDYMAKEAKPWEMQPRETAKQFEAFVVYRDMEERSLANAGKVLGKSKAMMERWSSANKWVERVAAWDNEKDRIARQEQIKEIRKMRDRHAKGSVAMFAKALEGLKNIKAEELTAQDIVRMFAESVKAERISRGDVGDVIEQRDGGESIDAVQIYIPDNQRGRDKETFDDLEV